MRLIDADVAIDALCKSECGWNNAECRHKDDTDFCVTCGNVKIIKSLPSAQPDAVTASMEELINDYGEDGYFIVDGVNYQANELLNELKINSSVGEKFRIQITKTIVAYFMKFGD